MNIKPISIAKSIWYFIISTIIIYAGLYYITPILLLKNIPFIVLYLIFFHIPLMALIFTALIAYRAEGNAWNLKDFSERLHLKKITWIDWLWTLGLFTFGIAVYFGFSNIGTKLAHLSFFSPPYFFPAEINPNRETIHGYFMDYKLSGQYWLIFVYFFAVVTNIFGEELLFRGIIFPRQIKKYGNHAWIYHAILWTFWHFFWKWNLLSILPFALGLSYTFYKRQNLWVTIIVHGSMNSIPLIMIIMEVTR